MKLKTAILLATCFTLLLACKQTKQFDNCSEMASDTKGKYYNELVEEFGEPYYKEEYPAGNRWYVKWKGFGFGGRDAKIYFNNIIYSWGESSPFTIDGIECDSYEPSNNNTHDTVGTTINEINKETNQYDKKKIERVIKQIKTKFYSIEYENLKIDTVPSDEKFEDDLTIMYKDKSNKIVKILTQMKGANIVSSTEYYYLNNMIYFIYTHQNGTNTSPKYERRTYIYNNDVIRIIENGKEIRCIEDCNFNLKSKPYSLIVNYHSIGRY